jgi:adenosine kinase
MRVLVTGSLGFDYIMDYSGRFGDRIDPDNVHKISLSFLVDSLNKQFGGTAGNIAYSLNLLGTQALIQSCAGNDFAPYKSFLKTAGISTKYIEEIPSVTTGTYFVVTDKDDNQIGSFYKGGLSFNKKLRLADITEKLDFVVIAPNELAATKQYVKDARAAKMRYMYDPAFQIGDFTPEELQMGISGAEILIGNDYEIDLIQSKLGVSHEELLVMGPKVVITTLGSKGSIIESRNDAVAVKCAKPKNVSDPTGAGDAYRAGFLAGYLRGFDLKVCGQMGAVAAAYTVEKYGTVTHAYTKAEFIKRYKENFGGTLNL